MLASAGFAQAATPVDGEWGAGTGTGANPDVSMRVEGGGRRITATNSFVYLSNYCGWGGAWNQPTDPQADAPPIPIAADGSFSASGGPDLFGEVSQWQGRFTSLTTFEITVTLDSCPYDDGPRTLTLTGGVTKVADPEPLGGLAPEVGGKGKPPRGQAYAGPPVPRRGASCEPKVSAGPLEGIASCWRRRGDVWRSEGRARINGIDVTPARGGIAIEIERRSYSVRSSGPVEVRVGAVRLFRGTIGWRPGRPIVFSIKGRSAKKDPGGQFDPEGQKLFGLPVGGSAELSMSGGKTSLKIGVEVPKSPALRALRQFTGWSGDLTASATNEAGLVLDGATVKLPAAGSGFIDVVDATLAISRQPSGAYHFDGSATVYPFKFSGVGILGQLGFGPDDGYLKLGAGVEQLNRSLMYGFFLQKIAFALQVNPFGVAGSAGVTFGPQFRLREQLISSARLDGGFSYLSGDGSEPAALELTGELAIAGEAKVADGNVRVAGGRVDVEGNANWTLGKYGLTGRMSGWFDGLRAFNLDGSVNVSVPGPDAGGEGVMSSRGVGACRRGFGPDVGFGYRWGQGFGGLDAFGASCDLGNWREVRAGAAAQAGTRTIHVSRGTRTLALAALGAQGAPEAAFTSPDGARFQPSAAPDGLVSTEQVLLVSDPDTRAVYLAVDNPAPGRWKIEALPGSEPLARVRVARAGAPLRLKAKVMRGRRGARTLRYRISHRNGARLTFVEQGTASRRTLGSTGRNRGALRFRPALGPAGRRVILAVVERGGHPTGVTRRAGSYRSARVRLTPPRAIRVRRTRSSDRIISWRGPRRARHQVDVRTSDGRRLRYIRPGTRRRVRVDHVPRGVGLRVTISARTAEGSSRSVTRRFR